MPFPCRLWIQAQAPAGTWYDIIGTTTIANKEQLERENQRLQDSLQFWCEREERDARIVRREDVVITSMDFTRRR